MNTSASFVLSVLAIAAQPEEVLLNLPKNFDVVCKEAYVVPAVGVPDGNREKFHLVGPDKPLVFRFRNGAFTVEHKSVERDTNGIESKWLVTITGKLERGVMTGEYRCYHTLADCRDPTWKDGFLCHQTLEKAKLSGQANADGRVKVVVSDSSLTGKGRPYGAASDAGPQSVRIKPLGDWQDISDRYQNLPKWHIVFELQLPVGRLGDTERRVP